MAYITDIHKMLNETALSAGIEIINMETAAKICAVIYEYDDERFTHSPKLRADLEYIQKKYGIEGGMKPNTEFTRIFSQYVSEVQKCYDFKKSNRVYPSWAIRIFNEKYNINLSM
jgi:hypothetical protein